MVKFILVNPKTGRNAIKGGRTFQKRQFAKNVKKQLISGSKDALKGQAKVARDLKIIYPNPLSPSTSPKIPSTQSLGAI